MIVKKLRLETILKVLVIGGGGREHALVWSLAQSPLVGEVICAPGNGGTALLKKCRNANVAATDIDGLINLARTEGIVLAVVGPEAPLAGDGQVGIVDLWPKDIPIVGPYAYAAKLEGSKLFGKAVMEKCHLPTAQYWEFNSLREARSWLREQPDDHPWVIKKDGLAAGKGVEVCKNKRQTSRAMGQMQKSGARWFVEECLEGPETSAFVLVGKNGKAKFVGSAVDHKRAKTGNKGGNTGGMGTVSPSPYFSANDQRMVVRWAEKIAKLTGFTGILFFGLIKTADGWKILEFNIRFGDPEAQVILRRLKTDLAALLLTAARGDKFTDKVTWSKDPAICVVQVAGGYPGKYDKGDEIFGLEEAAKVPGTTIFHAGTKWIDDKLVTDGGRVTGITNCGPSAFERVYQTAGKVTWRRIYYRTDIGGCARNRKHRMVMD